MTCMDVGERIKQLREEKQARIWDAEKILTGYNFTDEEIKHMDDDEKLFIAFNPEWKTEGKPDDSPLPLNFERKIGPLLLKGSTGYKNGPVCLFYRNFTIALENSEVREILKSLKNDDENRIIDGVFERKMEKEQK